MISSLKNNFNIVHSITEASSAGKWKELFGVKISHPGVEKDATYLWCNTKEKCDEIIHKLKQLLGNKKGGNKHRKMTVRHRKRRHQNKKTHKNKNKKSKKYIQVKNKKNRFILK
jgi:hypothetical protein